ncbi:MAG: sigma-70 family RNA polymerase sigma factor [Sedimentisphaerales bacterium]|nr:sigma-70 family RNA polymerase sigma factor [Sedimentisphaerales bacterium]
MQAAQAGDIDSFGKLCEEYYSPLVAVAYNALGDHQLAEDAAQEALARGLVNLRKLKDVRKSAPWLAQICRNVACDMVQSQRPSAAAEEISGTSGDCQAHETAQIVRAAIDRLPASMKEVVILRYYNNYSYKQITAMLGLPKRTINGSLTRAKRKLAEHLRRRGVPEDML